MKQIVLNAAGILAAIAVVSCAGAPADRAGGPSTERAAPAAAPATSPESEPAPVWLLARSVVTYADGTPDKVVTWEYDRLGRPVEAVEADAYGDVSFVREWTYGPDGGSAMEFSDSVGLLSRTEYEADASGSVVREVQSDSRGNVVSVTEYEYGEDGLLIGSASSDGSGTVQLIVEYSYEGDSLKMVEYLLPDGSLDARREIEYRGGLAVAERTFLADGTEEMSREYSYDGDRAVELTIGYGGTRVKSAVMEYDGGGNVAVERWINRDGREYEIVTSEWFLFEEASR